MELNEAIMKRRSVRAFLPDPVPRETIEKIVDLARWAPSWGNTQPWEIVVADGQKAKQLADIFAEEGQKGVPPRPDLIMPGKFPEAHQKRYMDLGRALLSSMGIEREDKERRTKYYLEMYRFFGAPAVIYLTYDAALTDSYSCLDIGSIGTSICYATVQEGLATIYLAASMHFPHLIRKILKIGDDKKIAIGIAIGYPHPDAPASLFRSQREPLEKIMRFA